jgi:hypothetical protein
MIVKHFFKYIYLSVRAELRTPGETCQNTSQLRPKRQKFKLIINNIKQTTPCTSLLRLSLF